jgi:hypothetical protein
MAEIILRLRGWILSWRCSRLQKRLLLERADAEIVMHQALREA